MLMLITLEKDGNKISGQVLTLIQQSIASVATG